MEENSGRHQFSGSALWCSASPHAWEEFAEQFWHALAGFLSKEGQKEALLMVVLVCPSHAYSNMIVSAALMQGHRGRTPHCLPQAVTSPNCFVLPANAATSCALCQSLSSPKHGQCCCRKFSAATGSAGLLWVGFVEQIGLDHLPDHLVSSVLKSPEHSGKQHSNMIGFNQT